MLQIVQLDDEDMAFLNGWHTSGEGRHRSLCPYHFAEPVPNVFGWTYEQLHWHGMGLGGVIS